MPPMLTCAEAADALSVHPVTIRRWAAEGRMPAARKIGGRWRFDAELLTEPLDEILPGNRDHSRRRRTAGIPASLDAALLRIVEAGR